MDTALLKKSLLELPEAERSATASNFVQAHELVDSLVTTNDHSSRFASSFSCSGQQVLPMDQLTGNKIYIKHCTSLIHAIDLTDARWNPCGCPLQLRLARLLVARHRAISGEKRRS